MSVPSTMLSLGSYQRASSRASNVRYEDGVICSAPGWEQVKLLSSLLNDLIAAWHLDEQAGQPRLDSSGNNHTLVIVAAYDPADNPPPTVAGDGGKIAGSALFESVSFRVDLGESVSIQVALDDQSFQNPKLIWGPTDYLSSQMAMDVGFQNPRIQWLYDGVATTLSLEPGVYLLAAVVFNVGYDSLSNIIAFESGAYVATIVTVFGPAAVDKLSHAISLDPGVYTLVIVSLGSAVSDKIALTLSLDSGVSTQTIFGSVTVPADSIALTLSLDSGSYG